MKRCFGIVLVGIVLFVFPIKNFANSRLSNHTDKEICRFASDGARWKTKTFFQQFVIEAKNRGLTISFCNSNADTKTAPGICHPFWDIQISDYNYSRCTDAEICKASATDTRAQRELKSGKYPQCEKLLTNSDLCSVAVIAGKWSHLAAARRFVQEAKSRGLTCSLSSTSFSGNLPIQKKVKPNNSTILQASSGSGFAVSYNGFIITNNHVINGCKNVFIHSNGREIPARIVTYDTQNDLALLKADFKPKAIFPLSIKRPELTQDIYVAGYPFGMKVSSSVKVTKGIISSLTGLGNNFSQLQIDAALQKGNSGGPILDDKGNVVGVAVSKLDVKYFFKNFGAIPENINFGIKSSLVGSILDSNGVNITQANKKPISKSQLGKLISEGTYYISCWMTMAQIEKMRTKKLMFSDFE